MRRTIKKVVGLVHVSMRVSNGRRKQRVKFIVDSGAIYSLLPETVWRKLGLKASRRMEFTLADGEPVVRRISHCQFAYQGLEAPSPVILGEGNDGALLGAVTLESLGLVLNPFERSLRPMRMMLARAS